MFELLFHSQKKNCKMKVRAIIPAIYFIMVFNAVVFCQGVSKSDSIHPDDKLIPEMDTLPYFIKNSTWLVKYDIDGDNLKDTISFDYTGGAHCCYRVHIKLSSNDIERSFPFELDGGYLSGVDSTQPEQFNIFDDDNDGLPEIFMKIQSYNGMLYPIPKKWKHLYRIKTNYIIIEYIDHHLVVHDR
jgi:hypothetical protein